MRAAAVQLSATPFDRQRNLDAAGRLARQAVSQGAQLVVLPELFNTGYVFSPRLTQSAEAVDGPTVTWLRQQSAALGAHLAGTLLLRRAGQVHNVFVLAVPDGGLHTAAKRHPFLWERCYFEPGGPPAIAETAFGRLGLLVGWDALHPAAWAACAWPVGAGACGAARGPRGGRARGEARARRPARPPPRGRGPRPGPPRPPRPRALAFWDRLLRPLPGGASRRNKVA